MPGKHGSPEERFWRKVTKGDGCWEWGGSTNQHGYGQIKIAGKPVKAHRFSWALHFGDPGDLNVLHTCDNPPCVRPDHLLLGTHADNMADMVAKGRQNSSWAWPVMKIANREKNRKLQDDEVRAIRRAWSGGTSMVQLGKMYGVQHTTIRKIVRFPDRYYSDI